MRSVCFAGLHQILHAVSESPSSGLTAKGINDWIRTNRVQLARRTRDPSRTTLYHYRNTLVRLNALKKSGSTFCINERDPNVQALVGLAPPETPESLSEDARGNFVEVVLRNPDCRRFFFDLFLSVPKPGLSGTVFCNEGLSVTWRRELSSGDVVFRNCVTGSENRCRSRTSKSAILYGVRYWARDELRLIDEHHDRLNDSTKMFPIVWPNSPAASEAALKQTVAFLLAQRTGEDWTALSVLDLVTEWCESRRHAMKTLFSGIDWLFRHWPHHTVAVPMTRHLATLATRTPAAEQLVLRGYYRRPNGTYISHVRLHKDIDFFEPGGAAAR